MKNQIITAFEKKQYKDKKTWPEFRPGDTVIVKYRVTEGGKSRVQPFEGVVIRRKRGTAESSFTVRKIGANGVGVERVFPLYSANIEDLTVKAQGVVRRSRLYYLRDLTGKAARIKSKFGAAVVAPTKVEKAAEKQPEPAAEKEAEAEPKAKK